ncbi:MAG: cryptochrome/photolyase family protein [Opitutales bacterium]|nr:cryptochrome/photolyase family protein [Opitutales bacterium]
MSEIQSVRRLAIVFGDQLDIRSPALQELDKRSDAVFMAEADGEANYVWSAKMRLAVFFSAMRHFAETLRGEGYRLIYKALEVDTPERSFSDVLGATLDHLQPEEVLMVEPGEWRILRGMEKLAKARDLAMRVYPDPHFLCPIQDFRRWAEGRKAIRLEYFYREMRRKYEVLLDESGEPVGGKWNFDAENRGTFGKEGPGRLPKPPGFPPDSITRDVIKLVNGRFAKHPGQCDTFAWPVTRDDALQALEAFVHERLPHFGDFQDAIWEGEPYLYHSLLSAALNLKLLRPLEVIHAAEAAWKEGRAPLNAVEGFIRQILGWREYVRGIYWWKMPGYLKENHLGAEEALPDFYWNGDTPLVCLSDAIRSTLENGYAHHIQRLMVTGLYALLLGVRPEAVHGWYLAVYVDAVEWVELPNTLGMSQFADGGLMASKPYAATGKYIQRMGNHCARCPKDPAKATGKNACPFTTLYWDFLLRHETTLSKNPRMSLQVRNLDRLTEERRAAIREAAEAVRAQPDGRVE